MTAPHIFKLMRDTDVSGVSGAGHVADGVVFGDGTTVLRWRSEHRSTAVYASLEDAVAIHGHNGATRFEFDPQIDQYGRTLRMVKPENGYDSVEFKNAVLKIVGDQVKMQSHLRSV